MPERVPANVFKQKLLRLIMARQHADFLRTNNPIYVWRAIRAAGAWRQPLPDRVRHYLEQCASALEKAATPQAIAAALGLAGRRGGKSKRMRAREHDRDERVVDTVLAAKDRPDYLTSMTEAIDKAADRHNLSREHVQRVLGRARKRDRQLLDE